MAIGPPSMFIPFMPMAAIASSQLAIAALSRHSQIDASATSSARQPPTIHLSRASARSSAISDIAESAELADAVRRHVELIEMRMRIAESQFDRPVGLRRPTREFGLMIFEAFRQNDGHPVLISGDGIADGFGRCVDDAG